MRPPTFEFDDCVFLVDLSAVCDPSLVGREVAGALRLQMLDPTRARRPFRERQTLSLLDNCEHLLDR